ncbi:MAG: hypothetical protein JWP29_3558 [Rhodoferax sp.]|nr:hypothetical protein [Rhodoferax sp.]
MTGRFDGLIGAVLNSFRRAGYGNGASGLNNPAMDRTTRFRNTDAMKLADQISDLYYSSGVAARIVDMPADDALARGYEIEGDVKNAIGDELDRLQVGQRITEALRWSRLFGGSVILLITQDGADSLEYPINELSLGLITELRVFDVTDLTVPIGLTYTDPKAANYDEPQFYDVRSPNTGGYFRVHQSRLIVFSGDPLPRRLTRTRFGGVPFRGRGALDGCYESIMRYDAAMAWTERMLERKQQAVFTMEGLAALLAAGMDDRVSARIDRVDMARSVLNTVVIDGGEGGVGGDSYEVKDLSLMGVTDAIKDSQTAICADTGFPVTALFGTSPSGLNSTGDNDTAGYFRIVDHVQRNDVRPALERLIALVLAQVSFAGARPNQWAVKFHPLWLPSEAEQAKAKLARAQAKQAEAAAAETYATAGAITPDEVRADLTKRGEYDLEAPIDTAAAAAAYAEEA